MDTNFGAVNGHLIGIAMKEMVRRAVSTIRTERFAFAVQAKAGYDGSDDDMVTSADRAAQEVYLRSLRECFPRFGVLAEEEDLAVGCTLDAEDLYFTVDPLDGTRAFVRRQSAGIGTMLALVRNGEVIGAYVGDVMTREIYGFRPGSGKVHRISEFEIAERLEADPVRSLASHYISLREVPDDHTAAARRLIRGIRGVDISGGSIGTQAARLWKGEVGAILLPPSHEAPWDVAPVVGISEHMGFGFYAIRGKEPVRLDMRIRKEVVRRDEEVVIVHASREEELRELLSSAGPGAVV